MGLLPQHPPSGPDAHLDGASGQAPLDALVEIVETTYRNDPANVVTCGHEALALLTTYPDAERELRFFKGMAQTLNNLGDIQGKLGNYD